MEVMCMNSGGDGGKKNFISNEEDFISNEG